MARGLPSVFSGKAERTHPPPLGCDLLSELVLELKHWTSRAPVPVGGHSQAGGVADTQTAGFGGPEGEVASVWGLGRNQSRSRKESCQVWARLR